LIERILKKSIQDYNDSEKSDKDIDLGDYDIQIIPYLIEEDEKEVYVNCYCDPKGKANPNGGLVSVLDGGNCYFNLRINLHERRYFDFMTNGHA
jgi:hypothetical protein